MCIVNGQTITLSQLATVLPGDAEAESRVTRIRRWLKNPLVDAWALYEPLLRHVLRDWQGISVATMSVIVDGTQVFGDRLPHGDVPQVFRLLLAHGNRAIPLWWVVVSGKGLVKAERLHPMFARVAMFLKPFAHGKRKRVICLADRGFRDHDWAQLCQSVGWDYCIRITRNTHIRLRNGRTARLDWLTATLKPGRVLCLNQVVLMVQHHFVTHVSITRSRGSADTVAERVTVISNQRAHPDRLREYGVRKVALRGAMDIEHSFPDDKSGGFDIDHTRLQHPKRLERLERLERLLLAVAIATLWCHELGEFVLQHGDGDTRRRIIDPANTRQLSLFQLGLRWLKRCLAVMLDALPYFRARTQSRRIQPWQCQTPSA